MKSLLDPYTCWDSRSTKGRDERSRYGLNPQSAAVDLDARAPQDLVLPVEWQVVRELGQQHMRDSTFGGQPGFD